MYLLLADVASADLDDILHFHKGSASISREVLNERLSELGPSCDARSNIKYHV